VVVWLKKHLPEQQSEQLFAAVVAAPLGKHPPVTVPPSGDEPHDPPELEEEEEPPPLGGMDPGAGHCETTVPPTSLAKAAHVPSPRQAWLGVRKQLHMEAPSATQHGYSVTSQLVIAVPAPPGWTPHTSEHCVPATTDVQLQDVAEGWLGHAAGCWQQHQPALPPPLLEPLPPQPPSPPSSLELPALQAAWLAPHSSLPQQTP
jgi:hypothetical protein